MSVTIEPEGYCTEHSCTCGPPPKRRRVRRVSILDVLNVDLVRNAIFHYVPLGDLLRSERVCQRWRSAVHHYLRGARRIRSKLHITAPWHPPPPRLCSCQRLLPLDESRAPHYSTALYKWGAAVEAAPCTAESFEDIAEQCTNIREITFYGFPDREIVKDSIANGRLRNLRRVAFRNLVTEDEDREQATDEDITTLLESRQITELTVIGNDQITGTFLHHLNQNITSLRLRNCPNLNYKHLLDILDSLINVTILDLSRNSPDVLKNVHLLLDVMPKLEHLELSGYEKVELDGTLKGHERLESLKHLNLRRNKNVNDDWLETIARGKKLVTFDVSYCKGVTMTGLTEVCESSKSMSELAIADNDDISDEDVETIIRLLPFLTILNIQKCRGVTPDLVVYLARIMRRRNRWRLPALRLRLYGTVVPEAMPMVYSFILDFAKGATLDPKPSPYLGF
ncbi:uncharacterized protein LOC125238728 [Leguminivora glycinivorella]|uniref:uncharacterized protein LOC125238728 n=1 Tax=Leguminivora glycinivorella TaxID=1035111 RepID=UPI00200FEC8F|nr:uncharacterized protein LOC125238728 [Leguminivora glycinivorella]